jgi:undecaprenyl-phosphate 4-deoxy-4-formamido-L-arabinose transferase
LICLLLILGGLILLGLGLIGEYLGRIYMLLNQQPQFTEETKANKARGNSDYHVTGRAGPK